MSHKSLTVGIPTYKRANEIQSLIKNLICEKVYDYIDIIVIDDGPTDGLEELLEPYLSHINLIVHTDNKGYTSTFCELFKICNTEYLLITPDDDSILINGIKNIIEYLSEKKPDFLSTVWLRNGKIYRGKKNIENISLSDVGQASNHAAGLVYKTDAVKSHLGFLESRLSKGCYASFFYPQVIILYILILKGYKCLWHPAAPIKEGYNSGSNLKDKTGDAYFSVSGRWRTYLSFIEVFENLEKYELSGHSKNAVVALKHIHEQAIYASISYGVRVTQKDAMHNWIAGSMIYNLRKPLQSIKYIMSWLLMQRKNKKILLRSEREILRFDNIEF